MEVSLDARLPQILAETVAVNKDVCQRFEWLLLEVYPGLTHDATAIVETGFREHLAGGEYLKKALEPLLTQYTKKSAHAFNPVEIAKITAQEKKAHQVLDVAEAEMLKLLPKLDGAAKPIKIDAHQQHLERVRDELLCEDMNANGCRAATNTGDCESNIGYMMFECPKSCGLCDASGKFCSDLYLKKCPGWRTEGQCASNKDYMAKNCRVSCGLCSPLGKGGKAKGIAQSEVKGVVGGVVSGGK